ncbi:hypothetical protein FEP12_05701 [Burkholderia multivorans]|nr:hypothetical protein [Burkholderia multivorans]MDR9182553.1 hypothetical protein [Burkholderia multivorans]MDR9188308.1 hypothetical protein [Burkholderia multivorans]MDR9195306.1 hypothetical protein [Burkholderia multivorans]MDR9200991.1 hypothetical protein [Burkholderia multivorans]
MPSAPSNLSPTSQPAQVASNQAKALHTGSCNDSTLVVVLGMHRSGTSAITRAMSVLGADLGTNLMPPAEGVNDKGFFEDLDINAINIAVLHAAGADWDTIAPIDIGRIEPQHLNDLQITAASILREKCRGKIFALKDPRIARLLPFWQPIFSHLKISTKYLIAFRNPISVTKSLTRRNQFTEIKSYLLWLAHTVPALEMTKSAARTLINYDSLMDNPRRELFRVASELDLPFIESALTEFEQEFLDSNLRHSQFAPADLELVQSAPRQVKALFRALNGTSSLTLQDRHELDAAIDDARCYLEDTAPLLLNEWHQEQKIRRLSTALTERETQLHGLNEQFTQSKEEIELLRNRSCTLNDEVRRYLDSLLEDNRALRALIEDNRGLDTLLEDNRALHKLLDTLRATVADQQAQLARASSEMHALLTSTSWRISGPLRALRRLVRF